MRLCEIPTERMKVPLKFRNNLCAYPTFYPIVSETNLRYILYSIKSLLRSQSEQIQLQLQAKILSAWIRPSTRNSIWINLRYLFNPFHFVCIHVPVWNSNWKNERYLFNSVLICEPTLTSIRSYPKPIWGTFYDRLNPCSEVNLNKSDSNCRYNFNPPESAHQHEIQPE